MNNHSPIDILLSKFSFSNEACQLYDVLRSLMAYPPIIKKGQSCNLEGKLYASGFGLLCINYIIALTYIDRGIDFNRFIEELEFDKDIVEIQKLISKISSNDDLRDTSLPSYIRQLTIYYRKRVADDIKKLFPSPKVQIRFFDSLITLSGFNDIILTDDRKANFIY